MGNPAEIEDFDDLFHKLLTMLGPEEYIRKTGVGPKEVLQVFTPEELVQSLSPEERLAGLDPEELVRALDTLPENVRVRIREKLDRCGS